MSRPVAVVTGSNCGVGFFTARALACAGYAVVVAARSPEKGDAAASQICEAARACGSAGYAVFMRLDLSSLTSVRDFAQRLRADWPVLHALVLNAGMNSFQLTDSERRTADGFDVTFQTNYIGHFLLAQELMPLLRSTAAAPGCAAPCRLVTLSSTTHRLVRRRDVDWAAGAYAEHRGLRRRRHGICCAPPVPAAFRTRDSSFSGMSTYTLSKLAMSMLALEWQRRLDAAGEGSRVLCVAVNPGAVRSSIWRRVPTWGAGCWDTFMSLAFLTAEQVRVGATAGNAGDNQGNAGRARDAGGGDEYRSSDEPFCRRSCRRQRSGAAAHSSWRVSCPVSCPDWRDGAVGHAGRVARWLRGSAGGNCEWPVLGQCLGDTRAF